MPEFGDRFVDGPHMSNPKGDYYFSLDSSAVYVTSSVEDPFGSLNFNITNSIFKEVFCVNCSEHEQYRIPEVVDVPIIKSISLQTDCSLIKNTYKNVFVVQGDNNDTIPLNIAVGNDRTMVCFAEVDEVISVEIEGNRKIDFLRLDTLSILKKIFTDLQLSFDEKTLSPIRWWIEGNYLGKTSDTEYLFEWRISVSRQFSDNSQYMYHTRINKDFDISLERSIRVDLGMFTKIQRGKSTDIHTDQYIYTPITIEIDLDKEKKERELAERRKRDEETVIWEESYNPEPPPPPDRIKRLYFTLVKKFIADGPTFKIETDSIEQSWYSRNVVVVSNTPSSTDLNDPIFWKVGQYTTESYALKLQLLHGIDTSAIKPVYGTWCNWSFLGRKIRNSDLANLNYQGSTFNSPHTVFELTKFSMANADTFLVKSYFPMFFLDYRITDEGKLLLLTRSRFSESNFGAKVDFLDYLELYKTSVYNNNNANDPNIENLNPDLISFISYIEVSSLNDLDSSRYKRTTKCDISGVNFNNNHFDAILKNGEEQLGTLDVGIYSTSELKGSKIELEKKQDDAIYILVGGYIFKYDIRKKIFWTGDGTKIRKIKNVNDAIDLSIRSLLFLNYNIKLTKPICHE